METNMNTEGMTQSSEGETKNVKFATADFHSSDEEESTPKRKVFKKKKSKTYMKKSSPEYKYYNQQLLEHMYRQLENAKKDMSASEEVYNSEKERRACRRAKNALDRGMRAIIKAARDGGEIKPIYGVSFKFRYIKV